MYVSYLECIDERVNDERVNDERFNDERVNDDLATIA